MTRSVSSAKWSCSLPTAAFPSASRTTCEGLYLVATIFKIPVDSQHTAATAEMRHGHTSLSLSDNDVVASSTLFEIPSLSLAARGRKTRGLSRALSP